jgi:DNA polymerase-3 subunit gamma/tau
MMVLAIDPSRASDPEFAPEGDLERLAALTARFSREDLLRAFDLLSRTEFEVRTSPHPRYHLEMALLKWIHLRKLVPLSDLIQAVERGERGVAPAARQPATTGGAARPPALSTAQQVKRLEEAVAARRAESRPPPPPPTPAQSPPARAASAPARAMPDANAEPDPSPAAADPPPAVQAPGPIAPAAAGVEAAPVPDGLRQRILDEIKKGKKVLYNTAVAQAQRIDVEPGRVTLAFTVSQKLMREQVEQQKAWLEAVAERVAGGPFEIVTIEVAAPAASRTPSETAKDQLKQRALGESAVQAMLDVFTAEIRDVEEIDQ